MWPHLPPSTCVVVVFLAFRVPVVKAFLCAVCDHNSTVLHFEALPALFGAPIPREGVVGLLIEARPADACQPIEGPPNTSSTFIVLIRRYRCSFATKVLHAQQAGFKAAMVYNVNSQTLVTMVSGSDTKPDITIPAMFTTHMAAKILKQLHHARKLRALILMPQYFRFIWKESSGMSHISYAYRCHVQLPGPCFHLVPLDICWLICIPVSVLITALLVDKYLSRSQKWKTRRNQVLHENGHAWTAVSFTSSRYQECAICLERYTERDSLKVLSCSHAFHSKCIDLWHITQARSKTCPLCMQKVMVVTRLQAVRLWKDGAKDNTWTLSLRKGKILSNGQRSFLLLSQRLPSRF